ncbi:MAG: methylmalonyl Co-A mutase-associated GTPase MeaB [Bacteroidota bacterium]
MSQEKKFAKRRLKLEEYIQGISDGNRIILSRAITLIESKHPDDNMLAEDLINEVLIKTGKSIRIGITGVPGSGKSTFIESFGKLLTASGKKVAVLTIDPSSQITKGSILGDKTRMEELANDPNAYVRPSSSGNTLGGVHSKTRESMLLCEAAGFDVIIIETVGVGQSETAIRGIVDFFLLIALSGAGDELQGIKRGIMEMADAIIINKADGDNIKKAMRTRQDYINALHMFPPTLSGWIPKVLTTSAINREGLEEVWSMIEGYQKHTQESGFFHKNRQNQNLAWMKDIIQNHVLSGFYNAQDVKKDLQHIEEQVLNEQITATIAAKFLIEKYRK